MHRHGYRGAKFGRERDQRRALLKSLADSLILHESIVTTLPKAKEVVSYTEKLITRAKVGGLHNRRQIISSLMTIEAAHKLVDELSPKLAGRNSGYFRIVRTAARRGDNSQMAKVNFVDDLVKKAPKTDASKDIPKKTLKAKPKASETKKSAVTPKVPVVGTGKVSSAGITGQAVKRTGRRGDR